MKLIVGLGNPDKEYQGTFHNLGFMVIDALADKLGVSVNKSSARALVGSVYVGKEKVILANAEKFLSVKAPDGKPLYRIEEKKNEVILNQSIFEQKVFIAREYLKKAFEKLGVFADITIVVISMVYIIFRCIGKYTGTYLSAKATKCSPKICKYLGITLFPQAGVALGMCTIAAVDLGEMGNLIRNITLFAVLVYEIVGPSLTKMALTKAGDIDVKGKTSARDDAKDTLEIVSAAPAPAPTDNPSGKL